jgi:hypothetical protein
VKSSALGSKRGNGSIPPANLRWRKVLAAARNNEAAYNLLEVSPAMRHPDVALPLAAKAVILSDERNLMYLETLSSAYYNFTDKHRKQAYEELRLRHFSDISRAASLSS